MDEDLKTAIAIIKELKMCKTSGGVISVLRYYRYEIEKLLRLEK